LGNSKWRSARVAGLVLALVGGLAGSAGAQVLGIGARMTSVSGPESPALSDGDSSRTRFAGGFVRVHLIGSLGFEAAMDYQSTTNEAETARVRNMPIQVSGLLLPIKKTFAPYLLGGIGWYKHRIEALDAGDAVASANTTDFGYHAGGGLQIKFGRHAALFADYRYVWADANGIDGLSSLIRSASSLSTVMGVVAAVAGADTSSETGISWGGSMWTGGLTIYF